MPKKQSRGDTTRDITSEVLGADATRKHRAKVKALRGSIAFYESGNKPNKVMAARRRKELKLLQEREERRFKI